IQDVGLAVLKEIFHRLFDIYVINVSVLLLKDDRPILYTYYPFNVNECHSWEPQYLASFHNIENESNFTLGTKFFPNKVANMQGCNLTIITWDYMPCLGLNSESEANASKKDGFEGLLLKFLIVEQQGNISILCFMYSKDRADAMLASKSYISQRIVLAIPHGRLMVPFEPLIKPFRCITWLCFSLSFALAIWVIYSIRFLDKAELTTLVYGHDNRTPFLNLLQTLAGGAIYGHIPKRNFARYILMMWLLYTVVLRTAYSGELFRILQHSHVRYTVTSLGQAVESNYTVYTFFSVVGVLKSLYPELKIRLVDEHNPLANILEKLSDPNNEEKIALGISEYAIRWYNQKNHPRRIKMLAQPLVTAPVVFFMPRHSYLAHPTGKWIADVLQSGLMKRMESSVLYMTSRSSQSRGAAAALSFYLLSGVFFVYFLVLVFCSLIFLLELNSSRSAKIRNLLNFLNV
ncbi:uncharacterized protein LOC106085019, partial [Stomoxys calcitrans]|uniref:uncharacterized protein LOC106085019 n=1 Tax=Stomoxys calcitrans TaxID=35570 RepID=UPI0027E24FF5